MPQRFLRPGIRTSGTWNRASFAAQSLYVSILTLVDDFGRYDGRAALIHGECFSLRNPAERINPHRTGTLLRELDEVGLIQLYEHEGKEYLQVLRWEERSRSERSKYPTPPERILRNPAESCGILPPSSSSSSSSLSPRHSSNGSASQKPFEPTDEDWLNELSRNPAYEGIDVKREHGKMVVWCRDRKKIATRRRFINWLNKCERPLSLVNFKRQQPASLDPAKIAVAPEFREWAAAKYPARSADVKAYKFWSDVPEYLRHEWKREKINPLYEVGKSA